MREAIKDYHNKFFKLIDAIQVTDDAKKNMDFYQGVATVCSLIKKQAKHSGKVFFIGNGGSAAIANHMAVDLWKNAGIMAQSFSDSSLLTCISNDFGYEYVFSKPFEFFADKGDTLIAISSSGKSKNILKAVQTAKSKGISVITLSGFLPRNPLRRKGKCNFYAPSKEYGFVEVAHQYICHCIADMLMKKI